jgi:hypothetical protein
MVYRSLGPFLLLGAIAGSFALGCKAGRKKAHAPNRANLVAVDAGSQVQKGGLIHGLFFGKSEAQQRESLAYQDIKDVKRGSGGRSLGLKITLADGTEGYFKPEQSFSAAHYYAELAAYYLDRELGLGRVPPTVGRVFPFKSLTRAVGSDERREELIVQKDGTIRGAFIWWIPQRLVPIRPGRSWERWVRIEPWLPRMVTPFQRPRLYMEKMGLAMPDDPISAEWGGGSDAGIHIRPTTEFTEAAAPAATDRASKQPDMAERPAELSDLIVFDFLTQNLDRWGGEYTNVRTIEAGGPLVYLDNGAGFIAQASKGVMRARLRVVERFRRSTIEAISKLDIQKLKERMQSDPLWPFLKDEDLAHLAQRKQELLTHVQNIKAKYGEAIFAW